MTIRRLVDLVRTLSVDLVQSLDHGLLGIVGGLQSLKQSYFLSLELLRHVLDALRALDPRRNTAHVAGSTHLHRTVHEHAPLLLSHLLLLFDAPVSNFFLFPHILLLHFLHFPHFDSFLLNLSNTAFIPVSNIIILRLDSILRTVARCSELGAVE